MMVFLTGAQDSLTKSAVSVQTDVAKSLGGYLSSSPVPNGSLNTLYDLISLTTLNEQLPETLAFGLVNKFDRPITNVRLKFVSEVDSVARFRVAAVEIDDKMSMEQIANRNQEPILGEFHEATFNRAFVDVKITNPGTDGEIIMLSPFDVEVEIEGNGIEATWESFEYAFKNDNEYEVKRIAEDVFRISLRTEEVVNEEELSYQTEGIFSMEYLGALKNKATGEVTLVEQGEQFAPGAAIGLWIQRVINKGRFASNEKLLKEFAEKKIYETTERVDLLIEYDYYVEPEVEPENPEENEVES